ncbi:Tyrosine-protein kinase ephrin type A/B receptor-like protein [Gracilaria domingensis]|nr:Tyrosine-protein kinase ephrin type A/B receptor-like protein [Gracilaria domingensis]
MQFGCYPCAPGTYQPNVGEPSCIPCEEGLVSAKGAVQCINCGRDRTLIDGTCATCPPGMYFYQPLGRCDRCPRNTFKSTPGLSDCMPCEGNSYADLGSSQCVTCPPGLVWADGACKKCAAGEFYNQEFNTCDKCSRNFITSAANVLDKCEACDMNSYAEEGSSSCTYCPKGMAMVDGKCSKCPMGTHFDRATLSCIKCSGGFTSAGGIMTECEKCPPGTNSFDGGECIRCEAGTVLLDETGWCGKCAPGYMYNSMDRRCDECPVQTFSKGGDETICHQCNVGSMAMAGSSECVWCEQGKVLMSNTGKCGVCRPGQRYNQYVLQCLECFQGSVNPNHSTDAACEVCPMGLTSNEDRTACVKGRKKFAAGYLH